jgi:hypothetical protein
MAAEMFDEDRMVQRGRVEVCARRFAACAGLGVVVLKADDPIARRVLAAGARVAS